MFERLSADVRVAVLAATRAAAVRRGESRIGSDHLLVGVADAGSETADAAGLTVEALHDALDRLDEHALGAVGVETQAVSRLRQWGWSRRSHLPFTPGAKKALERSLRIALDHGDRRLTTDHLLAALAVGGPNDRAVRLLRACWVEPAVLEAAARQALRRRAS